MLLEVNFTINAIWLFDNAYDSLLSPTSPIWKATVSLFPIVAYPYTS